MSRLIRKITMFVSRQWLSGLILVALLIITLPLPRPWVSAAEEKPPEPKRYKILMGGKGYTPITEAPPRHSLWYATFGHKGRDVLPAGTHGLRVELTGDAKKVMTFAGGHCVFHFNDDDEQEPEATRSYYLAIRSHDGDLTTGFVDLMCFDDFENLVQFDVDCWVTDDTFDPSVWDNDIPYGIEVTGFIWDGKESLVAKRQKAEWYHLPY